MDYRNAQHLLRKHQNIRGGKRYEENTLGENVVCDHGCGNGSQPIDAGYG
jgi:hypothetical protein